MAQSRYHHEEIYRGKDLVERLKKEVFILGAGALGSNLADALAREGFTDLSVLDKDRVETHNINTQVYGDMDVGALKIQALENRLFRHTGVSITGINKEYKKGSSKLIKSTNLVVDCFDNSASRKLVQDDCRALNIPCLHAGLFEDYGEVVWDQRYRVPADQPGDVCDYPLARNLIMLTVAVAAEEILDHFLAEKPRAKSWSITLKDLAIRPLA